MEHKLSQLPKALICLVLTLVAIGIVVLYSAADGSFSPWALKQLLLFCFASFLSVIIALLHPRRLYQMAYGAYFACFSLLVAVELLGYTSMGATRWLTIFSIKLQPSELAKFAIVLMLARYFHESTLDSLSSWRTFCVPAVAVLLMCGLIIKQPDLGTGIITLITAGMIFLVAPIQISKIMSVIFGALCLMPIAWNFLYEYQKKRVAIFFNPEQDPLGSGYNIIQSKIAIGSGGLFGKGFLQGSQSHLSFLPEHQTDFIFAFLSEEFGFLGGSVVIVLFGLLLASIIDISIKCKSVFLKLTAQGIAGLIFCHVFVNIAMVMGSLPAVGVPLPFISYGGTMMVSIMIGLGLVMNAHVHRNFRL